MTSVLSKANFSAGQHLNLQMDCQHSLVLDVPLFSYDGTSQVKHLDPFYVSA